MTKEMISVIIPIYNVEKYLRKCVNSVINQTYNNLEIILVDDGSHDNCPMICDEFEKLDRRVKVIHKKNGGLSNARNIGIKETTGQYIMLIDSDDFIIPQMAEKMIDRMKKDNTDLVICSYQYVDEKGVYIREDLMSYCKLKNEILSRQQLLKKIDINEPGYWFYSVPFNKLYKSEYLKKLKYQENCLFEDEFMAHYLFGSIDKASIMKDCLYMYTERIDSITHTYGYDAIKRMDVIFALIDRYWYFKKHCYYSFAKDTTNTLYALFIKIMKNAFKSNKDYLIYFGKMLKIDLILLQELNIKGIKLPFVYIKNWAKLSLRRWGK